MVAQVTKNAFKGYTYQAYVYLLFLSIMDTSNKILWINAEVGKDGQTHDFDDILIETQGDKYFVQMKNYASFSEDELEITDSFISINGTKSILKKGSTNIIVLHKCDLEVNTEIFGLPAIQKNNLYIIPLSSDDICKRVDEMYSKDIKRNNQICHFALKRINDATFCTYKEELPQYTLFMQKLNEETKIIRNKFDNIERGILYIVGKPGVGKSHFVSEFTKDLANTVIYRFWINSQDDCQNERLQYDNFIRDIGYRVFNDARRFSEEQLVNTIIEHNTILIIDGLDHVENYNKVQLDKYFEFINKLTETKTIVLTRPLHHSIGDNIITLNNWDALQTYKYLEQCHKIIDKDICKKIFEITDGYPILVNFSASHFNLYGILESAEKINDINEYFGLLLKDVNTISAILVFNITNSYLSRQDIKIIIGHPVWEKVVFEFIDAYPYLFDKNLNRFSLIHDSFNTYLRNKNTVDKAIIESYIKNIEISLDNNELRFMNRIDSINISKETKRKLLIKYCDFNSFEQLLKNNFDVEAIKEFYEQLYRILASESSEILNIYQYYSFILILECCNRIHLDWYIKLLYEHIAYIYRNMNNNIVEVYSNKVLFKIYKYIFKERDDLLGFKLKNNINYSEIYNDDYDASYENEDVYRFLHASEDSRLYFTEHTEVFDYERMITDNVIGNTNELDQKDVISDIIVNLVIHNKEYKNFAKYFKLFIRDERDDYPILKFKEVFACYGIRTFFVNSMLIRTKYKLFSLGYLKEINPYMKETLSELITHYALSSPDNAAGYAEDYIRLASEEGRIIDIGSVYKCYIMFYSEKDYSVISLPTALIAFEKHNLISEINSLIILQGIMNQATRGLSHLIEDYVNKKGMNGFISLVDNGLLDGEFSLEIFNLNPEIINLIPESIIVNELYKWFDCYYRNKILEEHHMKNVLSSKHERIVRALVKKYGFKIIDLSTKASSYENNKTYIERGYLTYSDKSKIIDNEVDYLTISEYKDGWHNCFNNLDLYDCYDVEMLRKDFAKIIHISMNSKIKSLDTTGNLRYYLGNIPEFANMIDYNMNWEKLYDTLIQFLRISSINPYLNI